jgi:hypothetical protein
MSKLGEPMNLGLQNYTINIMLNCRNLFWLSFSTQDLEERLHLPENFEKIIKSGVSENYAY